MSFLVEWRVLGVDYTPEGRQAEVISSGASLDELDFANDCEPPYDAIVVQQRTISEWSDVPDAALRAVPQT